MVTIGLLAMVSSLLGATAEQSIRHECDAASRPRVEVVYPTTSVLPRNLLRFYIYFDRAMARDSSRGKISIKEATGGTLDNVLLDSRFELWSEDNRRLTLVLDPGRVKSGLANESGLTPGLEVGSRYALVLGAQLKSQHGCSLASDWEHQFLVMSADTTRPDPLLWQIYAPGELSLDPVLIQFRKPLDHLSLAYRIRIETSAGNTVPGRISLGEKDELWRFHPTESWARGRYSIVIDPKLEDLAGNRPTGLFDDPTGESRLLQSQANSIRLYIDITGDATDGAKHNRLITNDDKR